MIYISDNTNTIYEGGYGSELKGLRDLDDELEKVQPLVFYHEEVLGNGDKAKKRKSSEEKVDQNNSNSKALSKEMISQYFYMPITQAAKELNVGLTLLKKKCRELGIRRWPHRKLMSLQTLIKNVQVHAYVRTITLSFLIRYHVDWPV